MQSGAAFSAVEIEINHACNRSCSYCPNSVLERKHQGEIPPALLRKLLAELAEIGFSGRISYDFYNEPMLHSDLNEVVRKTRSALPSASIELYTNGTLLTAGRLRQLLQDGVSKFVVTRHEADRNHRFEATFSELSEGEKTKVIYRPFTEIRLTNRGGTLRHLGDRGLQLLPCDIPSHIVTVTVNGNVLPCFEDFHEQLVMGNIENSTLMEVWDSEKYSEFRALLKKGQRHRFAPCRDCNRSEALIRD